MTAFESLPHPGERRVALRVTPAAERKIRQGHPWVWRDSVTRVTGDETNADLGVVFDDNRRFLAVGLWDPTSAIAFRLLHAGEPRTVDTDFFAERLLDAGLRRDALAGETTTTAWRMVHGENDQLPGLVVDRYEDVLVIRLDTAAWLGHLRSIVPLLIDLTDASTVVLRSSRRVQHNLPASLTSGTALVGATPAEPVQFLENGLRFEADVVAGQKTGHFLDQRDNRRLVRGLSEHGDVLDVFCNSGGFGVHAAHGGARSVHFVDASPWAVESAHHHFDLNSASFGHCATTGHVGDAFEHLQSLRNEKRSFDLVIIDPPSFAPNAGAVDAARRSYRRLVRLGASVVRTGGILMQCSCSSRIDAQDFTQLVSAAIADSGRRATAPLVTGHAVDHPIGFPEGAYLKAVISTLD